MADAGGKIEYDVVLVGAGPANLTLANRLVELANMPVRIAILEKSKAVGEALLSGAVSNTRVLDKAFPEWDDGEFPLEGVCKNSYVTVLGSNRYADVPDVFTPPYFKKRGYAILNISDVAAYMAKKVTAKAAEKDGAVVDIYPGFPARSVVYDGDRVVGVTVDDTGETAKDVLYGKVTVFGDKGVVSRDVIKKFNLQKHGQTYAVGVKEVWVTERNLEGEVWHTMGYPMAPGHLGGGFVYGCKNNKLIIGMVMGLDFANPNIRPPQVLQNFKKHPFIQSKIKGGKLLKYGASILPEGGFYSLPEKFAVDGAMFVGDALGVLDVKRFSGVDKAMESGYQAAEAIWLALEEGDTSAVALANYEQKLMQGWVGDELKNSRYFRKAFVAYPDVLGKYIPKIASGVDSGFGLLGAGISLGLSDPFGSLKSLGARKMMEHPDEQGPVCYEPDYKHIDPSYSNGTNDEPKGYDPKTIYSTADVVFYAHTHYGEENAHIDEFNADVCMKCIAEYDNAGKDTPCVGDCTAEVHQTLEKDGVRSHAMALENCVQCRTCELVCPQENLRVNAALHGYGPNFSGM